MGKTDVELQVNPRVDIAFKKIFGTEENKDLLLSLINSIVGEEDQVKSVKLLNPYIQKDFKKAKLSILDIKAEGHTGKKFNIEIQLSDEGDYDKRALYYWAKLYSEQLEESKEYLELNKVIGIHILNFISIPQSKKYHNVFHITEKETGVKYFGDLELHTIELKKFTDSLGKQFKEIGSKIRNALDLWSTFLTKHNLLKNSKLPSYLDAVPVKKAMKVLSVMNFSKEEREIYENHLKWLRIEISTLKNIEGKALRKGHKNGHKEGLKEGLKEGEKKGLKEGEKKRSIEIALNLLKTSLPIEEIVKATGLSETKIKKLQAKGLQAK